MALALAAELCMTALLLGCQAPTSSAPPSEVIPSPQSSPAPLDSTVSDTRSTQNSATPAIQVSSISSDEKMVNGQRYVLVDLRHEGVKFWVASDAEPLQNNDSESIHYYTVAGGTMNLEYIWAGDGGMTMSQLSRQCTDASGAAILGPPGTIAKINITGASKAWTCSSAGLPGSQYGATSVTTYWQKSGAGPHHIALVSRDWSASLDQLEVIAAEMDLVLS